MKIYISKVWELVHLPSNSSSLLKFECNLSKEKRNVPYWWVYEYWHWCTWVEILAFWNPAGIFCCYSLWHFLMPRRAYLRLKWQFIFLLAISQLFVAILKTCPEQNGIGFFHCCCPFNNDHLSNTSELGTGVTRIDKIKFLLMRSSYPNIWPILREFLLFSSKCFSVRETFQIRLNILFSFSRHRFYTSIQKIKDKGGASKRVNFLS